MSSCSFSPSLCHIDLGCLGRNFKKLGAPEALLPVIKSDAYGHGLMPVARTLDKCGCVNFAVGTVDEGVLLRKSGFSQRIVPLLGALTAEEWRKSYQYKLLTPVIDQESLKTAAHICPSHSVFPIAIALNTGMGRLGFAQDDMPDLIEGLHRYPNLKPELVFSHYACADMPEEEIYTHAQTERFLSMTNALRAFYPDLIRSLNNSAALLNDRASQWELSRPGICLYGGNPFFGTTQADQVPNFEWAMSVSAPILQVRKLKMGQSVSYGRIFTAPHAMTVAVIGIGYATGFARALSNKADVLIAGRRCAQIGRVCMGMIMADVTPLKTIEPGDLAWIMGGDAYLGERAITADELASEIGTISYELLCLFGATNERVYHGADF